jgi:hypothetical protein
MERLTSLTVLTLALALFSAGLLVSHGCDKQTPAAEASSDSGDVAALASEASPVSDSGDATATAAEE